MFSDDAYKVCMLAAALMQADNQRPGNTYQDTSGELIHYIGPALSYLLAAEEKIAKRRDSKPARGAAR
jgi:hypothetical protein